MAAGYADAPANISKIGTSGASLVKTFRQGPKISTGIGRTVGEAAGGLTKSVGSGLAAEKNGSCRIVAWGETKCEGYKCSALE